MCRHSRSAAPAGLPGLVPARGTRWRTVLINGYPQLQWKEVRKTAKHDEEKVKRMNLNVPVQLHNSFKSVTAAEGENMTDVLLEFIKSYVKENSPKTKGRHK